ncbi:penicillin acylase family protein [Pseudactinotalea sp. Z1732]|uniref:penicillin acylase family protein n=1 Tax=Pseudactinotalea sp. Z1732 TaxID=3413026 RepID=UPI003C7E6F73
MSPLSVMRRVSLGLAAALVVVLVAGLITTVALVRRPLPSLNGEFRVDGLAEQVDVIRDENGIPRIYAHNTDDLFLAQGYVHAQDRFFEMDYRRHLTAGRLSELVGEAAVAPDTVIRTMGWRAVAEEEWEMLDPTVKEYLESYTEGVNAYLQGRQPSQLALEYTVLGFSVEVEDIEPWHPVDSLAWLKAMAWDLLGNYSDELQRAAVFGQTDDLEMVEALFPPHPTDRNLPILPTDAEYEAHAAARETNPDQAADDGEDAEVEDADAGADGGAGALAQLDAQEAVEFALSALTAVPHALGEGDGVGSNSWVIGGEHTASGMPLLANDPHLGVSAPGIWYQVGLHCVEVSEACPFSVSGFSFAGLPGVVIGHNDHLAWGLTNLGADVSDFFLERLYPDGTYLHDDERLPLVERREVIAVNGGEDVAINVRSTPHGPIISDAIHQTREAADTPLPEDAPPMGLAGFGVALSWTALEPGRTAEAIFAINTATDAEDIAAAAALFEVPSQNIVFATTDGDIGYQAPGRIPIRADVADSPVPSDGTWPRPGWDSRFDWQGFVEPEDMPAQTNPDEGFIVAANQPVTGPATGPFLGVDFDYGYRSQRIRDLITAQIEAGARLTAADMNAIHLDDHNPYAEVLVPVLLEVQMEDAFVAEAVELFEEWDYRNAPDSAAAAYFASVWVNLLNQTFWDQMPVTDRPTGGSRWLEVVTHLLEDEDNEWWDNRATLTVVEQRDEILSLALRDAREQLTVSLGKDPQSWQWGRLHQAAPLHPVLGEQAPGPIRSFVNPDPQEVGGGSSIVNATGWDASAWEGGYPDYSVTTVPSMRAVADLADFDASTWVSFTGNSGHPAADAYDDQFGAWAAGETFTWHYSRAAVDEHEADTLTLIPAH